jgi:uncharacterized protein (TIGR00369 family)
MIKYSIFASKIDSMTSDELNGYLPDTLMERLGIRFQEEPDGSLAATMPVDNRTIQPLGYLHGGATLALMESLGSAASFRISEPGRIVFGIHLSANHIKSVRKGMVKATCLPVSIGERLHIWDITVTDEKVELVSVRRLSNRIMPIEQ